ncbi:MAG: diguanylate cyclase [Betaproteobacteria bacterium]
MTSSHRSSATYGKSLAGRLFKLVFGGYLILAVIVTSVQLLLEYSSVQRLIGADLVSLGQSFRGGVTGAVWELDQPLMNTMAQGIAQSSIVTGVKISATDGQSVVSVGKIPTEDLAESKGVLAPFQFVTMHLTKETRQGTRDLGELAIYADRSVALDRIKYSFFVILINSLVKTAGLWLIFYLVISKGLSRPLAGLTEIISKLEFASTSNETIPLDYPHQDELGRLMSAMQRMQGRLSEARDQLDAVNVGLEKTVEERTQYLTEALDFNKTVLLGSPLPMGVYKASGDCVLANEAYAHVVGSTKEALLGQNFHQIAAWKESGLLGDCLVALAHHKPQRREIHVVTSVGKAVYLECRILPTQLNGEEHLLVQFVDLTERKRLEEELREFAFHDSLTRLPNRRLLLDRLGMALHTSKRQNSYVAVLFIDLNKFKQLNDTHGHDIGDRLLLEVANRLRQATRDSDTVARLGGDEFVILLEGLGASVEQAQAHANNVADKISAAFRSDFLLAELEYQCSASIGIKLVLGDQIDPAQVIKDADAAMYIAKKGHSAK